MTLNSLTVVITGATGGLGRALCDYYNGPVSIVGYRVDLIVHGRDAKKLEALYPDNTRIVADLSELSGIMELANKLADMDIDILINNAAITCPGLPLAEVSDKYIKDSVNVNLLAPMLLSKYVAASVAKNDGTIVNINSMVALEPKKYRAIYSATKTGLLGFAESFRLSQAVNILEVYPTNIKTHKDRENAMNLYFVIENITDAINQRQAVLVLDGRSGEDVALVRAD
mgnify:FL=1